MTLHPSTEVMSMTINEDKQGYYINKNQQIYGFNLKNKEITYIMTLTKKLEGYVKLMLYNDELLLFNRTLQRIYALSLNEKRQRWYFYQHIKDQEMIDVENYEDSILILTKNKRNHFYYLSELNLLNERLVNRKRFKRKTYLSLGRFKESFILYDTTYKVHLRLDQHSYKEGKLKSLPQPMENENYMFHNEYLIKYNSFTNAIHAYNAKDYFVGINTILE